MTKTFFQPLIYRLVKLKMTSVFHVFAVQRPLRKAEAPHLRSFTTFSDKISSSFLGWKFLHHLPSI